MEKFVSDLAISWDRRPFVWRDGNPQGANPAPPARAEVLALAPHPDDAESAAVTLRLLRGRGCNIRIAVVTLGPDGVDDEFVHATPEGHGTGGARQAKGGIRRREQLRSAELFGLPGDRLVFLDHPESVGIDGPEVEAAVSDHLESAAPDLVILPCGRDSNRTHVRVCGIFRRWAAGAAARRRRSLVALYAEDPKTISPRDDLFVCFGEDAEAWKRALLSAHASQQARNLKTRGIGFDERIMAVNRAAAARLSAPAAASLPACRFAEAFEIEVFNPRNREGSWNSRQN